MREIRREIASALIFSKDGKLLMGKKPVGGGGTYADCWHIPGGGVDEGEAMIDALIREVKEETGLDISSYEIKLVPEIGEGSTKKIDKETGEEVMAHMTFNRFEIHLPYNAEELQLESEEFEELRWYTREELVEVKQIPGGGEFFVRMGYMDPPHEDKEFKLSRL